MRFGNFAGILHAQNHGGRQHLVPAGEGGAEDGSGVCAHECGAVDRRQGDYHAWRRGGRQHREGRERSQRKPARLHIQECERRGRQLESAPIPRAEAECGGGRSGYIGFRQRSVRRPQVGDLPGEHGARSDRGLVVVRGAAGRPRGGGREDSVRCAALRSAVAADEGCAEYSYRLAVRVGRHARRRLRSIALPARRNRLCCPDRL